MRTSLKLSSPLPSGLTSYLAFAQTEACCCSPNPPASEKAPEFSDADKKKMAEIEQRPEIKDAIQAAWDEKRRQDIDYIYNINSSAHFCRHVRPGVRDLPRTLRATLQQPDVAALSERHRPAPGAQGFSRTSTRFKLLLDPDSEGGSRSRPGPCWSAPAWCRCSTTRRNLPTCSAMRSRTWRRTTPTRSCA